MGSLIYFRSLFLKVTILLCLFTGSAETNAQQKLRFGVHADPIISWFSTDIEAVRNVGYRPGFNFGVNVYMFFSPNYAFSSGISIINAGGRLESDSTTIFDLSHNNVSKFVTVQPGEAIIYKIQYLSIPVGMKLQTNQIGYITFFTDFGIDPKFVIGGKADIPSLDIKRQSAKEEVAFFNLSYHIIAGIEYSVGGNTAIVLGLGFDNNFLDITSDNGNQPEDRTSHKLLSFRLGVNF